MMFDYLPLFLGILVLIGTIVTAYFNFKGSKGSATKAIADATITLINPLEDRIKTLEKTIDKLYHVNKELRLAILKLIKKLKKLNVDPEVNEDILTDL